MKKFLLFASALAGLFLAGSCQRENLKPMESANTVTYTVQLPGALSTKTIGEDVAAVTQLFYEVYRTEATSADDHTKAETLLFHKEATITNGTATVEFELVNDQNFRVLFWAQVPGNGVYNVNSLKNVTISKALNANAENYAAFAGADYIKAGESIVGRTLPLVRPIAQLNIGTDDASLSIEGQTQVEIATTAVTVNGLSTSFNVAEDKAGEISADDYVYAEKPVARTAEYPGLSESTFVVNGTNYNYVAMNYVGFAPQMGTNVKVTYTINTANVGTIENTIDNVPVKANHRTNIVGNLITSMSDYTITLDKEWEDEELAPEAIYLAAALGGELTLTEDITLPKPLVIQSSLVLNLNGHTITGGIFETTSAKEMSAIFVDNGVTLTIDGEGAIQGAQYGVYAYNGNLIVKNGNISANTSAVQVRDANVNIEGGVFSVTNNQNIFDYLINCIDRCWKDGSAKVSITGGTFNNFNPANNAAEGAGTNFVADGYKAVKIGDNFHVLPEVVADAATAANVTAVTESTADVATALTTDNGEATMFMWDDVAYIAKYGEVVITSSADDATTARGVVEYAAGLKTATVAEGIEVVGNRTFRKCANLETVVFPSTLTEIGPAVFQSCSKLANVTIPASVTTIGEGAFAECTSLTSINIPDGITRLEKDVLRNTGLTSIEIPASVNYIGTFAFRDCESLTEVKILSPEFTIENNTFTNMAAPVPTMTIYVVNAEMKAYLESVLTNYDKSYITVVAPEVCTETITDKEGVRYEGDFFASGYMENALYFKNYIFKGDAAIKVENRTYGAIILENCKADINGDLITIDNDNNSVMILQDLDLTLAEGKKLIKSVRNTIYQVFMANITINGVKMTNENIGQYLENVGWFQVVDEI